MTLYGRDANGNDAYIRGTGTGTTSDGHITFHDVFSTDIRFVASNITISDDLIAAVSNTKLRVLSYSLSTDAPCTVKFQSQGSDDITGDIFLAKNQFISNSSDIGLFETDTGDKLNIVITKESLPVRLIDATADTLAIESHGLKYREAVQVTSDGTLPPGLSSGTVYYVVEDTADTIKLATTPANASTDPATVVDITGAGTGNISVHKAVNLGVTISYRQV
jgi:hypothetical protein